MRQIDARPRPLYQILGVARVVNWVAGYFVLEGYSGHGSPTSHIVEIDPRENDKAAGLVGQEPGVGAWHERDRVDRVIALRRGQQAFRSKLLVAYDGTCAITSCVARPALEAAHISTRASADDNAAANGLLLRADVHTLFDLGYIAVHEGDLTVLVSSELERTEYECIHGRLLGTPRDECFLPDRLALQRHRAWAGL